MSREKEYYFGLAGLRGIFIIFIVLYHVNGYYNSVFSNSLGFIYNWGGFLGNYFFFTVSGFLIASGYRDKIIEGKMKFIPFIKKRIIKIYPLYIITNIVELACIVYLKGTAAVSIKSLVLTALMITSGWVTDIYPFNVPCWFVSALMLTYIIYYILCKISLGNKKVYLGLISAWIVWGCVLKNLNVKVPFSYFHNGEAFMSFAVGAFIYEMHTLISGKRRKAIGWAVAAFFAICMAAPLKMGA